PIFLTRIYRSPGHHVRSREWLAPRRKTLEAAAGCVPGPLGPADAFPERPSIDKFRPERRSFVRLRMAAFCRFSVEFRPVSTSTTTRRPDDPLAGLPAAAKT